MKKYSLISILALFFLMIGMAAPVFALTNPCDKQDDREVPYDGSYWVQPEKWHEDTIDPNDYKGNARVWIDQKEVEKTDAGKEVTIDVHVSGAYGEVSTIVFHVYHDTRLNALFDDYEDSYLIPGDAVKSFYVREENRIENGQFRFVAISDGNKLREDVIFSIKFRLPENLKGGEVFPIGLQYYYGDDQFINYEQNHDGMLLMTHMFTKGIENGYIKVAGGVTYTDIYFEANGGTGTMSPDTAYDTTYKLPNCSFSNPGYEFAGWKCPDGVVRQPGEYINVAGSTVYLYAQWKSIQTYMVSFDANGGSGSMSSVTVVSGTSYTVPTCGFKAPAGKVFDYWSVNGTAKAKPGDKVVIQKYTYFRAVWKEDESKKYLKSISVEVPEPVPGELPSKKIKITFDPKNAVKSSFYKEIEWAKYYMVSDDDTNYRYMEEGEKFEPGKYYTNTAASALALLITFGAAGDPDKVFNYDVANAISEDCFMKVNGKKVADGVYRFGKLEYVPLTEDAVSDIPDQTYTGKAIKPAPVVVVDDKTLVQDTDYTVSYKKNTNAGTASLTVTGKGKYTGSVKKTFIIKPASVSNATITGVKDKVYTGKALTQAITVKVGSRKLEAGTDYTESYKNNRSIGTATLTIKGKGNYTGTATAKFKIIPQGTTISSLTAGKKSFTVKWKKQATQTDGYLIQYTTDKDFKKEVKTKTIKKVDTTKATIEGLAGAKTYYVRICTYKLLNGKKYCSTWSKMKSVKTNK